MHYFKRNIGDYHKKAGRLSMTEHGAYTLLLDACYDRERFPTLEEAVDWCWARSAEEVTAVTFVLSKFFDLVDGRYVQARIQDEINSYHAMALKNKEIAENREEAKRTKRAQQDTLRAQNVNEPAPNQEPLTTNQEPKDQDQKICSASAAPAQAEDSKVTPDPVQPKASKGTRLAKDWTLPEAWRTWALEARADLGVPGIELEADKFRDHWHAATGSKATKADWLATWRNWIRNANAPRNVHQFPAKSAFTNLPKVNAEELRARTAENERLGVRRANF
ncbi:YdaU family protein [Pseudomonas gessardii]|uniref:YdaU family protein n=1 Tax=Pseudomonas gessardii TaxID=78544 RepID=UPI00147270C9|nr:YdaU family protein [Pseudomonas gessardii]NNA93118.1 YdaU family protein [Pseudomonas gessardii]